MLEKSLTIKIQARRTDNQWEARITEDYNGQPSDLGIIAAEEDYRWQNRLVRQVRVMVESMIDEMIEEWEKNATS